MTEGSTTIEPGSRLYEIREKVRSLYVTGGAMHVCAKLVSVEAALEVAADELATLRTQLSTAIGERDRLRAVLETVHVELLPAKQMNDLSMSGKRIMAAVEDALSTSQKDGTS